MVTNSEREIHHRDTEGTEGTEEKMARRPGFAKGFGGREHQSSEAAEQRRRKSAKSLGVHCATSAPPALSLVLDVSRTVATGYYLTVTAAAVDGMPLATTSSWPAPVSIPDGTSKLVVIVFDPVATPIELWSWVRQ